MLISRGIEIPFAYVAGIFDGEGSLGLYEGSTRNFSFRCQLVQNYSPLAYDLWNSFTDFWGGKISSESPSRIVSGKSSMNWQIGQNYAEKFLTDIRPWLILKADQADCALEWFRNRKPLIRNDKGQYLPRSEEEILEARAVALRLKALKKELSPVRAEFDAARF